MKTSNMRSDNSTSCGSWLLRDCLHTRWNCTLFFLVYPSEFSAKRKPKIRPRWLNWEKSWWLKKSCPSGPRRYNQCRHYRKLARAVSRDKEGGFKCSQSWNNNWALILFFSPYWTIFSFSLREEIAYMPSPFSAKLARFHEYYFCSIISFCFGKTESLLKLCPTIFEASKPLWTKSCCYLLSKPWRRSWKRIYVRKQ